MNNIMVSFCIATYQRYEILRELIEEILSIDDDRFEIVVCDDCSLDGSVEKLQTIQDSRLHIYINKMNVGSQQNIYESLEHGKGKYLFYINDRDNVDFFKIKKLISILEKLEKKDVAFIKCTNKVLLNKDYQIYLSGEEALLEFANRISHVTGYIFYREVWKKIHSRKKIFMNECFGDYSITLICSIIAKKYNGAIIFGDICECTRERIDFESVKSGYYCKRKDKRIWYSAEVQLRELLIAYKFLKTIDIEEDIIEKLICQRYKEYLKRVTIGYKELISKASNTSHYNIVVSNNEVITYVTAIKNGLYLWSGMWRFCKLKGKRELIKELNYETKSNYYIYIKNLYEKIMMKL